MRGDEAVSGSAAGADLEEGHGSLRSVQRKNHAVCYQILDLWWDNRLNESVRDFSTTMDALCMVWNNSPRECNNRTARGRRWRWRVKE